ncbi:MAG: AAA family ATPase [Gaiellaceae bacterium]
MSTRQNAGTPESPEPRLDAAHTDDLHGREAELELIAGLLDGVRDRGAVLLVRGAPGIGKSALLGAAGTHARRHELQVLSAVGVQSEAHLPFGGLHQLLRPILGLAEWLPARQRDALLTVFGMSADGAAELFLVGLATLELIGDAAARSPALLTLDDAQWLDDASSSVLAFVARRLQAEQAVMLAAIRDGHETPFDDSGSPELRLPALDTTAAAALLDARTPGLEAAPRQRVLAEAGGNPLALVELPAGLRPGESEAALLGSPLPLTAKLERAFATQASGLPPATQTLLRVAAVDDAGVLDEILAAASVVEETRVSIEAVAPAVAAQLVELDGTGIRFRHPLVRSSIYHAASVSQRQAAHEALSSVLAGQSDRQVWHRAAAALGPNEEVAAELDAAAERAAARGAAAVAIAALERAVELSECPDLRGSRLVRAAGLAFELGRPPVAMRLLRAAELLDLGSDDWLRLSWLRDTYDETRFVGATANIDSFVESAERLRLEGRVEIAMTSLLTIALTMYWSSQDDAKREIVVAAAERLAAAGESPGVTAVLALAAPVERASVVLGSVRRFPLDPAGDPVETLLIGQAASAVGEFARSTECASAAAGVLRGQGRLGLVTRALVTFAFNSFYLGTWQHGCTAADEAARLARETGQGGWAISADLARATLDAVRGNDESTEALAATGEAAITQFAQLKPMLALVQQARGVADLAAGRHAEAYGALRRIFDPTDVAHHPIIRCWLVGELAEAAANSDQRGDALSLLEELEQLAADTGFPYLLAGLAYARPLLADDDEAEELFRAGLTGDPTDWPFLRARLLLAHGSWLRRRRRVAESRIPLRSARETFDALGAGPWGDRARQELRASGVTSRRRAPETRDQLTPQELHIAGLAADGLSNREIGQQLYISHRTVGYHLRQIFPKLGITSRSQLHAAMLGLSAAS